MNNEMFRAVVLSIVLTLAANPSAALLCGTWCDPHTAAADGCHHTTLATSVSAAANHTCEDLVVSATFVREDVRRGVSGPDPDRAVLVLRYHLAHTTTEERSRHNSGPDWSLEKRPLSTTLRI
jgi:hypothetical protein